MRERECVCVYVWVCVCVWVWVCVCVCVRKWVFRVAGYGGWPLNDVTHVDDGL